MRMFTRLVVCSDCGQYCERDKVHGEAYWKCKSENRLIHCAPTPVPESVLLMLTENMLETSCIDKEVVRGAIQEIRLFQDSRLIIMLQDGHNFAFVWNERRTNTSERLKGSEISRMHMKRVNLPMQAVEKSQETSDCSCRFCGKAFPLTTMNRMKRFCSEHCRQKWWRAHPGVITQKVSVSSCANCGLVFKNGGNPKRRFCSRSCYFQYRFGGE